MIVGIGVDTVDIERFEAQLSRTPKLRSRLFTPSERVLSIDSLAARFAAKESLIKALRGSDGLGWHDMEVLRGVDRVPTFTATQALQNVLSLRGIDTLHLSISHDGTVATAFVVAERANG